MSSIASLIMKIIFDIYLHYLSKTPLITFVKTSFEKTSFEKTSFENSTYLNSLYTFI